MSSHDARYEDSESYRDEHGTTATRTDQEQPGPAVDRDDSAAGPVLLPMDAEPEPTPADSTAVHHPPVTIEDAEDSNLDKKSDGDVRTGFGHTGFGEKSDLDRKSDQGEQADSDRTTDSADVSVGPDTETGALKDPVPDGSFASDTTDTSATSIDATSTAATSTDAAPTSSTTATSTDVDWRELQGRFVDDPQAAVREAGALVEKALSDLRTRSESGSTEDLRTAFRRYRDLYAGLT